MSSRRNRKNSMADNDDDDDDDDNEFHDCLDASEETVSVSSAPAVHEGAAAGKLLSNDDTASAGHVRVVSRCAPHASHITPRITPRSA